jgi:hypothetical protein
MDASCHESISNERICQDLAFPGRFVVYAVRAKPIHTDCRKGMSLRAFEQFKQHTMRAFGMKENRSPLGGQTWLLIHHWRIFILHFL